MINTRRNAQGDKVVYVLKTGVNAIERFIQLCREVEEDYPRASAQAKHARETAEELRVELLKL